MKLAVIDDRTWQRLLGDLAFSHLDDVARERLRELAGRFLGTRRIVAAGDLELDPPLLARVAAGACLLVLFHGRDALDVYGDVREIIIYPTGFRVDQRWTDEYGVEHEREADLAGEAWEKGPVILAAADVLGSRPGFDVVLHEFAHVLDAGNGTVNGFPMIRDMALRRLWPSVFAAAFERLDTALEADLPAPVDDYAAETPAEFFAVLTETLFTDPLPLADAWPDVHDALVRYYGQDPVPAHRALANVRGARRRWRHPRHDRHGSSA